MSLSDAKKALESHVILFAKDNGMKCSFENAKTNNTGQYIECFILPIEPAMQSFSSENHQHIFQSNFYFEENQGSVEPNRIVGLFLDQFTAGCKIGESSIVYRPSSRSQGFNINGKYCISVSVYFQFSKSI